MAESREYGEGAERAEFQLKQKTAMYFDTSSELRVAGSNPATRLYVGCSSVVEHKSKNFEYAYRLFSFFDKIFLDNNSLI